MKRSIMLAAALLAASATAEAGRRERQLEGIGAEGERVVLTYKEGHPQCHGREMVGTATWPDGRTLTGCWTIDLSYVARVRWRDVAPDGRPVEWTVAYTSLDLRYVTAR